VSTDRERASELIVEATKAGARQSRACEILGLDARTVQRWRRDGIGDDRRMGPKTAPGNKLTKAERERIVEVANSAAYRELSPKQIVPRLADQGDYIASESSFYRVLREQGEMSHRTPARPPSNTRPREHVATGPCQVCSWDITYLRSALRGSFFYLYMAVDVWSRRIVGWAVHDDETMDHASRLIDRVAMDLGVDVAGLVLHSDNGGPMKGSTMLATLQRLGIVPSFSRPQVSDDNPYSEALFRTMKYRPEYPQRPFETIDQARAWVEGFVRWYNTEHLHSGIGFVTPEARHAGEDVAILAKRRAVYEAARRRHPERWTGDIRNCEPVAVVRLNPQRLATGLEKTLSVAA
jgi:transposase InsO family protein